MPDGSVLVTGGAGFIGSHLVDLLLARGRPVVVLDDLSTGCLDNLAHAQHQPGFRFVSGSVLDQPLTCGLVREAAAVVHLAAVVGVRLVVEDPLAALTTNIRGTEVVLEAARSHGRRVLVVSTSEIYGRNPDVPLAETADRVLGSPSVARWAYSTSKAVDEILANGHHRRWGVPTVIARLFNAVGPRQSAGYGMVVPRLVRQAVRGEPLTVFGDGRQTRCFTHVLDMVTALAALLDCDAATGGTFNVGSEHEISIIELAERVRAHAGNVSPIRLVPYEQAYGPGFEDTRRRVPDTGRIRHLTGWSPARSLDDILRYTIRHARAAEASGSRSGRRGRSAQPARSGGVPRRGVMVDGRRSRGAATDSDVRHARPGGLIPKGAS